VGWLFLLFVGGRGVILLFFVRDINRDVFVVVERGKARKIIYKQENKN
jgi:hypothetical protein